MSSEKWAKATANVIESSVAEEAAHDRTAARDYGALVSLRTSAEKPAKAIVAAIAMSAAEVIKGSSLGGGCGATPNPFRSPFGARGGLSLDLLAFLQWRRNMGRDDEKIVQLFPKRDFEDRHWYRLEGHTPVAMRTFGEWEAVMIDRMERARHGNDPWRVAYTDIGEAGISTVFLGLNHNFFGGGPPLLFETIIFGGHLDEFI
jgi:hypothetical protein